MLDKVGWITVGTLCWIRYAGFGRMDQVYVDSREWPHTNYASEQFITYILHVITQFITHNVYYM